MTVTGIICEYNPFHNGHKKQLDMVRNQNPDGAIVCLMSGNFVQRGAPAIIDKQFRAEAAIKCGADLVLEMPVTASLSSAEGFAEKSVKILDMLCDELSFGAEDPQQLPELSEALLTNEYTAKLKDALTSGCSFPAARQRALEQMGLDAAALTKPNNILATEYCKAILSHNLQITPQPILRQGDYHSTETDTENPSATSARQLMEQNADISSVVPECALSCMMDAALHTLASGERAILARLRCMTEADFKALPYGSEGLWRKFMHAVKEHATIEQIIEATKSKRYTRTRIDRMVMCAFLGLTTQDLTMDIPYCRILAFNDTGRQVLSKCKKDGFFVNIGQNTRHPWQDTEDRMDDLYGLFCQDRPEKTGRNRERRVYYHQ